MDFRCKRTFRAKPTTIPIIVITANPQYHLSQQESQWAGAAVFLTKPFGAAKLVSAIQGLAPIPGASMEI